MNEILDKIEKLRKARKWTVYKLSQESEVPTGTIQTWIRTNSQPSIKALEQICRAFGVTLAEFFLQCELVECTGERRTLLDKWQSITKEERAIVKTVLDGFACKK